MMFIVFSVHNRSQQSPGAGWKKKDWNSHSNLVGRMDPVQCLEYQCYMHTLVWSLEKLFNTLAYFVETHLEEDKVMDNYILLR